MNSDCQAGSYGIGTVCTECPDGQTSAAESLFVEDCFYAGGDSDKVIDGRLLSLETLYESINWPTEKLFLNRMV